MRRRIWIANVVAALVMWTALPAMAQQDIETERRAQTTMKFLSVSPSARAAALSNAMTALEAGPQSVFYNPGALGRAEHTVGVSLSHADWFADFNYNAASATYDAGTYGVFGAFVRSARYGEFLGTVRADTESGYSDTETFSPSGFAVGISYGRALTDRFAVGGNLKYARQSLGESVMGRSEEGSLRTEQVSTSTPALDLGIHYRTGYRSLNFAVAMRNLSPEVSYVEESVELPLVFRIGASMDVTDFAAGLGTEHGLLLSVDAERPRDFAEHLKLGGEYRFSDILMLRAGYAFPGDAEGASVGGGLTLPVVGYEAGVDYAYTQYGQLGNVHRFGVQLGI